MKKHIRLLLDFSRKKRSLLYKICSLILGFFFFFVIFPLILITFAQIPSRFAGIAWPRPLEMAVASASFLLGLVFLVWSIIFQWRVGKGTPAPVAPPQTLIIAGPYRLCRNPIQLGLLLYYLGVGAFWDSLTNGLICSFTVLVLGIPYHRFVEEKELSLRFGEAYKNYREKTPYLIPRLRS